jgi:hypothetical protein
MVISLLDAGLFARTALREGAGLFETGGVKIAPLKFPVAPDRDNTTVIQEEHGIGNENCFEGRHPCLNP